MGNSSAPADGSATRREGDVLSRLDELRFASIVIVGEIRSKFLVVQGDGQLIDVTLRAAHARPDGRAQPAYSRLPRDGSLGSDALTVIDGKSGVPTIYLKLGRGDVDGPAAAPPRIHRQASGHRALQKTYKRWKPALATELDRYLGEGAVRGLDCPR